MGADPVKKMSSRRSIGLKGGLWQLLLLVLTCPVSALAANMTMEISLGYGDLIPLKRWVPLNVVLENKDRAVHGWIEAVVTAGSEYHDDVRSTIYSRKAELPTNTRKLYPFTIRLDTLIHPLIVRLREEGRTVLSRELNLRNYGCEDPLVLVLGGSPSFDFLSRLTPRIRPVYPRVESLPESWYGYDGVETVIIRGSILSRLRQRQMAALKEWMQRGGYCVIPGGINFSAYLGSRMRDLLPVDILGLRMLPKLHSLEEFSGHRLSTSDPFLVLEARPRDGTVVLGEGDIPIIVRKDLGLGRVLFLALDPDMYPFPQWEGRSSLWERILRMRPEQDVPAHKPESQRLASSLLVRTPARLPSHVSLLVFVSIYLLLVYHAFYLLREKRWPRRRTLSYLAASVSLFSVCGYYLLYARNMGPDPIMNGFACVRLKEEVEIASVHGLVGVYSVRGGNYRFALEAQDGPISAVAAEVPGRSPSDMELREGDEGREILISMDRWSYRFFQWESKIHLPLGGRASMDRGELVVSVENMTPYTLRDWHIYFADRLLGFGSIGPDGRLARRFGEGTIRSKEVLTADVLERMKQKIVLDGHPSSARLVKADVMGETIRGLHSIYSRRSDVVVVLGWIDSAALSTRVRGPSGYMRPVALIQLEMRVRRGKA